MKHIRTFAIILAVILIVITLPMYLTISGLSFMAFDSGDMTSVMPWIFVGGTVGVSILVPVLSLISAIKYIRREKVAMGLVLSLIPALVLGIFWMWVSQQSFT